jgi:FkbM family methyltransferase
MDDLLLNLSNGTRLYVPARLDSISTYVALEQETWFEKEFAFLDRLIDPGDTVIDIGANYGFYSLALAKLVGKEGRVFAYEPTTVTRESLKRSRDVNGFSQIEVLDRAVSDSEGEGRIVFGRSSELNYLGESIGDEGDSEAVRLTSLDVEVRRGGWSDVSFVKIDAEGAEEAILRGGHEFLTMHSPVVMMEIRAATEVNYGLVDAVGALGYQTYRLTRAPGLLLRARSDELERTELNVLAMKPERAAELASNGLLIDDVRRWTPDRSAVEPALQRLRGMQFATSFPGPFNPDALIDSDYVMALGAFDVWRSVGRPLAERWGALTFAADTLQKLTQRAKRFAWLSTLARVEGDRGNDRTAARVAEVMMRLLGPQGVQLGEPFWPACARFDALPTVGKPAEWFLAAVVETFELKSKMSTAFGSPSPNLDWLCRSSFASPEMLRRQYLHALRGGVSRDVPIPLLTEGPDNVNAAFWAAGNVRQRLGFGGA